MPMGSILTPRPNRPKKEGTMPPENQLAVARRQVTREMEAYFAEACVDFDLDPTEGVLEIIWDPED